MTVRALIIAIALWAQVAAGAEEILHYVSDVEVQTNGELTVTETITVRAEGDQIRRGIYRDFPTDYRDAEGRPVRVTFDVVSTRRDERPEPRRLERRANGVRVYLGSADLFLEPGSYTYEIVYRTRGQLGHFDGFDEIYWNATGNGWAFPIQQAVAIIRLPEPVPAESLELAGYTGPQGSTGKDYEVAVTEPGLVRFQTTRPLGAREGLTVAVGFPKGIIEPPPAPATPAKPPPPTTSGGSSAMGTPTSPTGPTFGATLRWTVARWAGMTGLIAVLAYYILVWRRVGRDPKAGVIIPRYEPPEGFSPAALRYIRRMKYDATCMAAALVNLAVKGAITIHQHRFFFSRWFSIQKVNTPAIGFAAGEKAVYDELLGSRHEFEFKKSSHRQVKAALEAQKEALERDHRAKSFRLNRDRIVGGLALSLGVVVAVEVVGGRAPIFELAGVNLLFVYLMKAPTRQGRRVMDEIEGLRLYLGVAEKETFENMDRPRTLEEFERLLPYAVALECADTWVKRFRDVLEDLERAGELSQRNWMSASGAITADSIAGSVDGLADSFADTISSSSSPPGSSSGSSGGSSGGGSSGGGGGGGGGGGW